MNKKKKKVFVGLSGGVDSSVSAGLLKKEGYAVTGVFIKVWHPDFLPCDWKKDRLDAMRVCAKLEIPFLTFDFEKEYKEEIIDYMINEYKEGKTPNPDVMCNKQIKFGAFLKKALEIGADYVATGHYARKLKMQSEKQKILAKNLKQEKEMYELFVGKDKNKDQSYFLWTLGQEQLKHILFPIGEFEKKEVRRIAEKFGLLTAKKKDSQGLCFIGKLNMKDFLKNYIKEKEGKVLNEDGKIIGRHSGTAFLTIGQRHGFVVTDKGINDKPYYIVSKDIKNNTITVSQKCATLGVAQIKLLDKNNKQKIEIENISWISGEVSDINKKYEARIRYRQELQKCKIKLTDKSNLLIVEFEKNQDTATAGQSLVIYDGEKCLGGGIIT